MHEWVYVVRGLQPYWMPVAWLLLVLAAVGLLVMELDLRRQQARVAGATRLLLAIPEAGVEAQESGGPAARDNKEGETGYRYLLEEWLAGLAFVPDLTEAELASGAWMAGATARDVDIATVIQAPIPEGCAVVTAERGLHVRVEPVRESASRRLLASGQRVTVWGRRGDWRLVQVDQLWGWAHGDWLRGV